MDGNDNFIRRNPSVAVEIKRVERALIRDIGSYTGTLYPRSQFVVAPKVSGRLENILVEVGDLVKKDQLIALLDNDEYKQQVDQARAELEVARANLEEGRNKLVIAERELTRVRELRKKKIASESELDEAEANFMAQDARYKVSAAQVEQKKAALKATEVRLSYTEIRASGISGDGQNWVVGERFVDKGSMLSPNTSIVSILDISTLTAVIHVIERDYSKVKMGQKAVVQTDVYPGREFAGEILRIAPLIKEASRQARVEIKVPNQDNLLKPGMFVRVQIEFEIHPDSIVIPLSAVVKRQGRSGIFIADLMDKKAGFVPVTLGIIDGDRAEVTDPPISGHLVTMGQHLLEDGTKIILPDEGKPGPAGRVWNFPEGKAPGRNS